MIKKACHLKGKFIHCRKESPKKFDKRSFRVKKSGKAKIVIGCPKGKFDPKKKRCKVGTRIQKIMYPATAASKRKHLGS